MDETSLIVVGSLNTDIIASGLKRFPNAGEHVYGEKLTIGPGGKSRNIAAMAALLMGKNKVAMIGRTAKDDYGLWKIPLDALHDVGVGTKFVKVLPPGNELPAIALISVDGEGNNQIIVLPGASNSFSEQDIDDASSLYKDVANSTGFLVSTLECPMETMRYAIHKANSSGIKVLLDPGGIEDGDNLDDILPGLYLLKPNEHEARMLTGITVTDEKSAAEASNVLMNKGVQNVLITIGAAGAYLFTQSSSKHISIPTVLSGEAKDETGCGDQTMAALVAMLQGGKTLEEAAKLAIVTGTLQFHRQGIQPVSREEIEKFV